jgi:uncharacterized membrane protein YdjX (TVP38/TMEM64 family)
MKAQLDTPRQPATCRLQPIEPIDRSNECLPRASAIAPDQLSLEHVTPPLHLWTRYALSAALILVIGGAWLLHSAGHIDIISMLGTIQQYPTVAGILFVLIYAGLTAVLLPALPLNLAAGMLWGVALGSLYCTVGGTLGACAAFLLARAGFGEIVRSRGKIADLRFVKFLMHEVEHHPWRCMAFIRLNFALPTGPLNYLLGLMPITFRNFALSTFVFLAPPAILIAALGELSGQIVIAESTNAILRSIMVIVAAATLVLFVVIKGRHYGPAS